MESGASGFSAGLRGLGTPVDIFAKCEDDASMHVISRKKLKQFAERYPAAESPLNAWNKTVRQATWRNFADVRAVFPSADQVGKFTVFDIGGNKFRFMAVIHFNRGKVFVRQVLTHQEYDRGQWKND